MEQNKDNFSVSDIKKMAQSDAGRQLMDMLDSATVKKVQQDAKKGDFSQMQETLRSFLSNPKAQALLKQLEEQSHG